MPRRTYEVQIGDDVYDIDSDADLTDDEAISHAMTQAQRDGRGTLRGKGTDTSAEPDSYWGGVWKGLKNYGKDLVTDPATMGMVGAGMATALAPATAGSSLLAVPAFAGLGAAGGAGVSHIIKQAASGRPDDSLDVLGDMVTQGGINGALTAVPGAARLAGPKLVQRAERLAAMPMMERNAPAAVAGLITHNPVVTGAVAGAQMPMVNRAAGRALTAIGDMPETAGRMFGRTRGAAEAAEGTVDRFMPNRGRVSREVPGFSMPEEGAAAEALPRSPASIVEEGRYSPNVSSYDPNESLDAGAPSVQALIDRFSPNVSSYGDDAARAASDSELMPGLLSDANAMPAQAAQPDLASQLRESKVFGPLTDAEPFQPELSGARGGDYGFGQSEPSTKAMRDMPASLSALDDFMKQDPRTKQATLDAVQRSMTRLTTGGSRTALATEPTAGAASPIADSVTQALRGLGIDARQAATIAEQAAGASGSEEEAISLALQMLDHRRF